MSRGRSQEIEIRGTTSGFELGDLRWLVESVSDLHDEIQVDLYYSAGAKGAWEQFDQGYATLSVKSSRDS